MIVDNVVRLTLQKGYIDLIDDRITVIGIGDKTVIMKCDIVEVKSEEYNTKTPPNNIRIGTRISKNSYVSKNFNLGSNVSTQGELVIHYNDESSGKWIYLWDTNPINVNVTGNMLNDWLSGKLIPSELVKNYNERKKTLKFRLEYYLPMVLFILFWVWVIHKVIAD